MPSNNYIYKMSNAGGMSTVTRYTDMLAGNTTWNPWEPTGAYDALASVTVPSGGAASVTFAGIPTGYKHLQVRYMARDNRATFAADDLGLQFNGDTATSSYASHRLYGIGSGSGSADAFPSSSALGSLLSGFIGTTATSGQWGSGIIDILDYANISKNKTIRVLSGTDTNGGTGSASSQVGITSGLWLNTGAITSMRIFGFNGNTLQEYSSFALYGVK